ncbi:MULTISPECIES: P-loop NTPase [Enterococcus]|uniref:P-loop NTPase n=1 Tax=Enterococcus TaxID=1350 RepID=UPI00391A8741
MELKDSLNYVFDGDAILFLGAGFSIFNTNSEGEMLPLTKKLSEVLQLASGISEKDIDNSLNIQQTSEYFIEKNGATALVDILKKNFTVTKAFKWQRELAKFNWKSIYTTNYDNVFEIASDEADSHRYAVNISKNDRNPKRNPEKEIIHLNGYVDFIDEENLRTSTKLTSESYIDTNFLNSTWRTEFEIDIEHAQAIFFVGFSLNYDLDLKRLISIDKRYKEKIFFINGREVGIIERNSLSKYGTVLDMTAEEFSNYLCVQKESYIPKVDEEIRTFSFEKKKFKLSKEKVRAQDISDLLFMGTLDEEKLYSNLKQSRYVVFRSELNSITDNINTSELFIVHSALGNGKSIFLKSVEYEMFMQGYTVYSFNGNSSNILNDIERLKNLKEKVVVIIDDYYSLKNQFKYFVRLNKKNFKFVIAGRTNINNNNMVSSFIDNGGFNKEKVRNININSIDEIETDFLFRIVTDYNLWGRRSSDNQSKKRTFLKKNGKQGFKNIALELVKSNNILNKLFSIYNKLNPKQKEVVLSLLISNLIRSHLSVKQILTITKNTDLSQEDVENADFKEFVDISNDKVMLHSSIAAKELLRLEEDKFSVIKLMEKMLKTADSIDSRNTYEYFKRQIVSFSNLKLILTGVKEDEVNQLAVEYFENIRNERFTKENPFFWLQYGIQKIDEKKYPIADVFLNNALSYADKRGYSDFYQINAQKARGMIEQLMYDEINADNSYPIFEKAHYLLVSDLEKIKNDKSYQLAQGKLYELYFTEYYEKLDSVKQASFNLLATQFKNRVDEYIELLDSKGEKPNYKIIQSRNALNRITLPK